LVGKKLQETRLAGVETSTGVRQGGIGTCKNINCMRGYRVCPN